MIFDSIALAIGGLIAASPDLVRFNPGIERTLRRLESWQGSIGLTLLVLGIIRCVQTTFHLTEISAAVFLVRLTVSMAQFGLGLLLAASELTRLPFQALQKQSTSDKILKMQAALLPFKVRLGFAAIALGVIFAIA